MRLRVRSLDLLSGLRIQRCRELWCRPAAVAPIQPLAWDLPYAANATLKSPLPPKKKPPQGNGTCWMGRSWKGHLGSILMNEWTSGVCVCLRGSNETSWGRLFQERTQFTQRSWDESLLAWQKSLLHQTKAIHSSSVFKAWRFHCRK